MDLKHSPAKAAYRPDIDGLRAIAVLLVVFNHVGIARFRGGFVGVDVFFVISGYLISGLILKELAAGKFSIRRFYERRFRRIMPALLAMLFVCSIAAVHLLYPLELTSFARDELATLFSVSNVVLQGETGYFDPAAKAKVLLHTWSLGVEEQFYVVFPVLLLLLFRWVRLRNLARVLWPLIVALFALSVYWTSRAESQAFFFAQFRAWEFLLGALLALEAVPALEKAWQRNAAAGMGLLLILWAGLTFSQAAYPGKHALVPCLGAFLLIAAGQRGSSLVGRCLSWGPIRFIGLISYSLYLWHWPLQVFQSIGDILVPDRYPLWASQAAVIVASMAVAAASWKWVEQPFRAGRLATSRVALYSMNGCVFGALVWFSASVYHRDGWLPSAVPQAFAFKQYMEASPSNDQNRWNTCFVNEFELQAGFARSTCLPEHPGQKQYLLVGDSHSGSLYWGLKTLYPNVSIAQISVAGCVPVLPNPPGSRSWCDTFRSLVFDDFLEHHHVDAVILVGRWETSDELDHLHATTDWLEEHGLTPVVVGPFIEFDAPMVRLLGLSAREHDPDLMERHRLIEPEQMDRRMLPLLRDTWHVRYISMYEDLCAKGSLGGAKGAVICPLYGAGGVALLNVRTI